MARELLHLAGVKAVDSDDETLGRLAAELHAKTRAVEARAQQGGATT